MARSMEGKHVIITGGTGALGGAVMTRFLAAGAICHLPVQGRSTKTLEENVVIAEGVDLTNEGEVDRFYDSVPELWASINLAGGFAMAPLSKASLDDFRQMMEINAVTAFTSCRAAARVMRKYGVAGRIVNVTARPALTPRRGAGMTAYAASKAAVAALTVALAEELKEEGILVNAIAPSTLDTPANRAQMPNADTSKWVSLKAAAETVFHFGSPANMAASGTLVPLYARA